MPHAGNLKQMSLITLETFLVKYEKLQVHTIFTAVISPYTILEILPHDIRQNKGTNKPINYGGKSKKKKVSLFVDIMIIYLENP